MMNKPLVVTVSQLNRKLALTIAADKTLEHLSVRGENYLPCIRAYLPYP